MKHCWLVILLGVFASAAKAEYADCNKPLVISFTGDWEPYIYSLPNGRTAGTDFTLLTRTLDALSCDLNVLHMNAKRVLREVSKGTFDVILGATYTSERAENFHFSVPYRKEVVGFATREDAGFEQLQLLDILIAGGKVAINIEGYFGESVNQLKVQHSDGFVHRFSLPERLQLLADGVVDAVVDDRTALCQASRVGQFGPIKISQHSLHETQVHFIFSRKSVSTAWLDAFNESLFAILKTPSNNLLAACQPIIQNNS